MVISQFCSSHGITWKFIPEHTPHFEGLWEAAVKSLKMHLRRVVSDTKLTFEELTTVLSQVEACLNSRPIALLPDFDDGVEALTPGHFLIGRTLEAIPHLPLSTQPISLLRRWCLCQTLVCHVWRRWRVEYVWELMKFKNWQFPERNFQVGDLVCLRENGMVPCKWPLARVVAVNPGDDGLVRVVTVKTSQGTYTCPVTKTALISPIDTD